MNRGRVWTKFIFVLMIVSILLVDIIPAIHGAIGDGGIVDSLSAENVVVDKENQSITILNPQAYPYVGENWTIQFNTTGSGILEIHDHSFPEEVGFVGIYQKEGDVWNWVPANITDDLISAQWNYPEGRAIFEVLTAGEHILEFRFGNVAYARNQASVNITQYATWYSDTPDLDGAKPVSALHYVDAVIVETNNALSGPVTWVVKANYNNQTITPSNRIDEVNVTFRWDTDNTLTNEVGSYARLYIGDNVSGTPVWYLLREWNNSYEAPAAYTTYYYTKLANGTAIKDIISTPARASNMSINFTAYELTTANVDIEIDRLTINVTYTPVDLIAPTVTINTPTTSLPVYRKSGEQFYVNFTYTEVNPANYTVNIFNSTAVINTTTVDYPTNGTNQVANVSFYLNTSAADGFYNVSVGMYDNSSNYVISYQNNSVVKDETSPTITIDEPTTASPVYRSAGELFYVNFTYNELLPANYTVNIFNSTAVINTTTVDYPAGGTDQVANESFNLNSSAADGFYNVSVEMYDNGSYYNISYQNNSVVKDDISPTITIDTPTTSLPVYRESGELFYVNFTYNELLPANYTVNIFNSTAVINTTTVDYPVSGINQVANVSFNLNTSASDGCYNVSVGMYDNSSNYNISYQNNSVMKDENPPTITIDTPTTSSPVYRKSGELFYVNFTYAEPNPANYTVNIFNSTAVINTTTVDYPAGGTDQVANESFNLNSSAADGFYNVSVEMYDNCSKYGISYQNNSVVKDDTPPTITIDEPTTSSPVYRKSGEQFYVNFTYTELNPANYTVNIFNSTAVINTTTVDYPAGGTDQVANVSFNLNTSAADGFYNVSVGMYGNVSNYVISYQNNSVVKDATSPTITIDEPTTPSMIYRTGGEQFWVNFTYTELNPLNYTVNIYNSTSTINTTPVNYPVGGTDQVANVSFNLNPSVADGCYNVSVGMYDNCSNYVISYQNNSVMKDENPPTITIDTPTTSSPVYRNGGEQFYVNFTYSEMNPANYTVNIFNCTAVINTTTVNYPTCGVDQVANVSFNLNTSAADSWYNVSVEMYDNVSNYGISYQNKSVAKGDIPPVITTPPDQTVELGRTGYITWILTDTNPKNYWVLRNGVQIVPPTVFTTGVEVNVEIDTSTLGIWNYTIVANDTIDQESTDEVIITVAIRSLPLPEFNIIGLIALICTLSITLAVSTFRRKD